MFHNLIWCNVSTYTIICLIYINIFMDSFCLFFFERKNLLFVFQKSSAVNYYYCYSCSYCYGCIVISFSWSFLICLLDISAWLVFSELRPQLIVSFFFFRNGWLLYPLLIFIVFFYFNPEHVLEISFIFKSVQKDICSDFFPLLFCSLACVLAVWL